MRLLSALFRFSPALALCAAALPFTAGGQSLPTASRDVAPSVFGGLTGTYTGLNGGRNLGITAGLDVAVRSFAGLSPAIEVRGTYPADSGQVVGEESVEGGLRVQKRYRGFRPYADFLFGRGQLDYQNGGYPVPLQAFRYLRSTSNVISPGVGVEADLSPQLGILFDAQLQIWSVPFDPSGQTTNSGHIFSVPATIGVVYRFGWLQHGHAVAP